MRRKEIERIVSAWAIAHYEKPEKEALECLVDDWGKEALHGYIIVGYSDDMGEMSHIEKLDELDLFSSDCEAGKQAKKDGIKLIPYSEQFQGYPYRFYRFLDTEENRKKMEELKEENKRGIKA